MRGTCRPWTGPVLRPTRARRNSGTSRNAWPGRGAARREQARARSAVRLGVRRAEWAGWQAQSSVDACAGSMSCPRTRPGLRRRPAVRMRPGRERCGGKARVWRADCVRDPPGSAGTPPQPGTTRRGAGSSRLEPLRPARRRWTGSCAPGRRDAGERIGDGDPGSVRPGHKQPARSGRENFRTRSAC